MRLSESNSPPTSSSMSRLDPRNCPAANFGIAAGNLLRQFGNRHTSRASSAWSTSTTISSVGSPKSSTLSVLDTLRISSSDREPNGAEQSRPVRPRHPNQGHDRCKRAGFDSVNVRGRCRRRQTGTQIADFVAHARPNFVDLGDLNL